MSQVQWSSRLGHVLAAAGTAIGLGAIWKFPYVTATNGGGAFLLVFLLFSFTLGVAVLMGETLLGSLTRRGVVGAFGGAGAILREGRCGAVPPPVFNPRPIRTMLASERA